VTDGYLIVGDEEEEGRGGGAIVELDKQRMKRRDGERA